MKLVVKGKYESEAQLPLADLPPNAVRFAEPESPVELNKRASLYALPTLLLVIALIFCRLLLYEGSPFGFRYSIWLLAGMFISFLFILPHELLHGLCFSKDAEVQLFYFLKAAMAFVICTEPIGKGRFIWLSLCPNLLLGWLPLLLWTMLPLPPGPSHLLFGCAASLVFMGVGDYMNAHNALKQMPKGSMQVLSGFHSYWYMP